MFHKKSFNTEFYYKITFSNFTYYQNLTVLVNMYYHDNIIILAALSPLILSIAMSDIATRAIENNIAVQRAVQEALVKSHNEQYKNTRKNYEGKQQEWILWCTTREFTDGSIVTQGTILLFLEKVVQSRGSRTSVNGGVVPLSVE